MKSLNLFMSLFLACASPRVYAASAAKKGEKIARDADEFHAGYVDYTVDGKMILKDKTGNASTREIALKVLEGSGSGDRSLMVFMSPADIKGTSLLVHSSPVDDDERWLYLPSVKRVKRIAMSNKSGPFLGSEFTYEDLTPREVSKYTYKFLREEVCGSATCYVLESRPKDKGSAYKRHISWIEKKNYIMRKTEFFDVRDAKVKTMTAAGYQRYPGKGGQHWAPRTITMENHLTGKSTTFKYENYHFGSGLSARQFDKTALAKGI